MFQVQNGFHVTLFLTKGSLEILIPIHQGINWESPTGSKRLLRLVVGSAGTCLLTPGPPPTHRPISLQEPLHPTGPPPSWWSSGKEGADVLGPRHRLLLSLKGSWLLWRWAFTASPAGPSVWWTATVWVRVSQENPKVLSLVNAHFSQLEILQQFPLGSLVFLEAVQDWDVWTQVGAVW